MSKLNSDRRAHADHHSHQQGFALPLALISIALLSAITLAGYRAVSSAAEIASVVQENTRTELAFFSAENESAFMFLTSPPIELGILTSREQAVTDGAQDGAFGQDDGPNIETLAVAEHWRADGQARLSSTQSLPVVVVYHDAAGFPPIAALPEEDTTIILAAAGFESDAAAQYAARIADFQDDDTTRRFRGAERSDYRLYGASPPTNSPLRTAGELTSVLGFAGAIPTENWDFFVKNIAFGGFTNQFIPRFGPPSIAALFENADSGIIATDPLETYLDENVQPTSTARFLLAYRLESGLTRRRAVEIMRTAVAADKPFRRIWIYDKAEYDQGEATPAIERRDLAPVFQAVADPDPR